LNRLKLAQGGGLYENYIYDDFGNLKQSGNFSFLPAAFNTANQPLPNTDWPYDAAGNLLADGLGNTFTWDANVMISSSNGTSYYYDAEGDRVGKSGTTPTDTVYFGGRPVARYASSAWTDLIYGAGGLLAEVPFNQSGAQVYRMTDHLGSSVGLLSSTGALLGGIQDYAPFGQLNNGSSTNDPYKFTGKERDTESGNDYFGARYYSSTMGRFMSPDWSAQEEPVPYAKLDNPQSLNLYAYVGNNPLTRIDADGHLTIIVPGTGNKHKDWDNSGFKAQVSKKFGENAIVLGNDHMGNSKQARAAAAKQLEGLIAGHDFAPGEKLNIVSHSHGGNVVAEATQEGLSHKIDTLVTLGVPVRSDYQFNESVISQHLNVYSNHDYVQRAGGMMISVPTPYGSVPAEIPAGRQVPGVQNLDATSTASSHSNLWQQPQTWDQVVAPEIK
jgi:RHS repeat-associated protein